MMSRIAFIQNRGWSFIYRGMLFTCVFNNCYPMTFQQQDELFKKRLGRVLCITSTPHKVDSIPCRLCDFKGSEGFISRYVDKTAAAIVQMFGYGLGGLRGTDNSRKDPIWCGKKWDKFYQRLREAIVLGVRPVVRPHALLYGEDEKNLIIRRAQFINKVFEMCGLQLDMLGWSASYCLRPYSHRASPGLLALSFMPMGAVECEHVVHQAIVESLLSCDTKVGTLLKSDLCPLTAATDNFKWLGLKCNEGSYLAIINETKRLSPVGKIRHSYFGSLLWEAAAKKSDALCRALLMVDAADSVERTLDRNEILKYIDCLDGHGGQYYEDGRKYISDILKEKGLIWPKKN